MSRGRAALLGIEPRREWHPCLPPADSLSEVLRSVRLEGAVYLAAEFTAPWCIEARHGLARVRARLAGAERLMFFHFVAAGGCKVRPGGGGEPIEVATGDLVVFIGDEGHLMASDLRLAPAQPAGPLGTDAAGRDGLLHLRHGGGGEATRFVCGYIACGGTLPRLLFDALPRAMRIPIGDTHTVGALQELFRLGVHESSASRPGSRSMLIKLSELVFVEALRRYLGDLPAGGTGWLSGIRDVHVGRALARLHSEPVRSWTVERLAREAALSRSAFAERFASLVGIPPMQYLTQLRLALAAEALRSGNAPVSRVAEASGYESRAAFNRAFKREFGLPPTGWRRRSSQGAGA